MHSNGIFCLVVWVCNNMKCKKSLISSSFFKYTLCSFCWNYFQFIIKKQVHWIIWIAILLCLYGSYLLSSNQSVEIQQSDSLLFIAALFFALHIICIDIFMKELNSPFLFGSIQYFIVFVLSMILAFIWEEPKLSNSKLNGSKFYTLVFFLLELVIRSKLLHNIKRTLHLLLLYCLWNQYLQQ